jgi:hypothetical protein
MSTDVDLAVLETKVTNIETALKDIRDMCERLPTWAVWAFTLGGGVIGSLITLLVMCRK